MSDGMARAQSISFLGILYINLYIAMDDKEFEVFKRDQLIARMRSRGAILQAQAQKASAEAQRVEEATAKLRLENRFTRTWTSKIRTIGWAVWLAAGPGIMIAYKTAVYDRIQEAENKTREAEEKTLQAQTARSQLLLERAAEAEAGRERLQKEKIELDSHLRDAEKKAEETELSAKSAANEVIAKKAELKEADESLKKAEEQARRASEKAASTEIVLQERETAIHDLKSQLDSSQRQLAEYKTKGAEIRQVQTSKTELATASTGGDVKSLLAFAVLEAGIQRGFYLYTDVAKAKFDTAISGIQQTATDGTGAKPPIEGTPIGLIDLTVFGGARNAIVFTTTAVYCYVDALGRYQKLSLEEFIDSSAVRSGIYRASLTLRDRTFIGPIVFAGSDVNADQFIKLHEEFKKKSMEVALPSTAAH